jgi:hypothetical protein
MSVVGGGAHAGCPRGVRYDASVAAVYALPAGNRTGPRTWKAASMGKYDLSTTTLGALLEDPDVVAILEKHSPGITSNPMLEMAAMMPADQAVAMAAGMIGPEEVEAISAEINALD